MIPYWLWSWILTAVGVFGLYAAGSKRRWGWLVGLGAQFLWIAYALSTRQYGFLVSAVAYGSVYARNFRAWRRDARPAPAVSSPPGRPEATEHLELLRLRRGLRSIRGFLQENSVSDAAKVGGVHHWLDHLGVPPVLNKAALRDLEGPS